MNKILISLAAFTVAFLGGGVAQATDTNQASYWEATTTHPSQCYKHEANSQGDSDSDHGKSRDSQVKLNTFNQSWPGDHWELLVIKAGTQNVVIDHPSAGVWYDSPDNKDVSHWIVCKGETPQVTTTTSTTTTTTTTLAPTTTTSTTVPEEPTTTTTEVEQSTTTTSTVVDTTSTTPSTSSTTTIPTSSSTTLAPTTTVIETTTSSSLAPTTSVALTTPPVPSTTDAATTTVVTTTVVENRRHPETGAPRSLDNIIGFALGLILVGGVALVSTLATRRK